MVRLLRSFWRPIRHPETSGQAIIVLALGFIGLVGFVGIVTDVSLLLARYSTLARAVDSAAISAAGQMRSDRSFGEVGLAARMMLELHGIDSEQVLVETCASTNETDTFLCSEANRYRKLVRVGAKIQSPTIFLRLLGIQDITLSAISTSETAVLDIVLVMDVSESMLHDTTYQDWAKIGMGQVYVPPAWAGYLNPCQTSPSPDPNFCEYGYPKPGTPLNSSWMGNGLRNREIRSGWFVGTDPNNDYDDGIQFWGERLLGSANGTDRVYPDEVNARLNYVTTTGTAVGPTSGEQNYKVTSFPLPGTVGEQKHPRTACRVRFWPYSNYVRIPQHIREISGYSTYWEGDPASKFNDLTQTVYWQGFVPTYDFYGCCNDATYGGVVNSEGNLVGSPDFNSEYGDFNFSDLICQPFKAARDATLEFLGTVDFERGDRVAIVTFDRGAFLIDPDGSLGRDAAANTDTCPRDPAPVNGKTTWTHMMASYCRAVSTLNQFVGVRAEPNFYRWKEEGGGWDAFAKGRKEDGTSLLVDYYNERNSGGYDPDGKDRPLTDYPVRDFCPFQDAALSKFQSLYSLWNWDLANPVWNYWDRPGLYRIMTPTPGSDGWSATGPDSISESQSYELWASCRGTNIGAGLREGNNALLDPATTRRTGTVWVMVMLSDGAAGASDPVRLNGRKPLEAEPFYDYELNGLDWVSYNGIDDLLRYGRAGEYGAFGLCPIGTPDNRSQLTRSRDIVEFPFCSDEQPATRHFCQPPNNDMNLVGKRCPSGGEPYEPGFAPGSFDEDYQCELDIDENLIDGNIYDVDIGNFPNETADTCDPFYDVDDYARDWADYVGLSRSGAGDEQLPIIFTIGFGLNFRRTNTAGYINPNEDPSDPTYDPHPAEFNVADFLGEEMLRYIADVGDNFQIDTDYQQDLRQDRQLNGVMNPLESERFGPRGPCEDQTLRPSDYVGGPVQLMGNGFSTDDGGNGTMVRPLPPRQDCGNYYNAPDQARLRQVFDDIASRMFTRLAP